MAAGGTSPCPRWGASHEPHPVPFSHPMWGLAAVQGSASPPPLATRRCLEDNTKSLLGFISPSLSKPSSPSIHPPLPPLVVLETRGQDTSALDDSPSTKGSFMALVGWGRPHHLFLSACCGQWGAASARGDPKPPGMPSADHSWWVLASSSPLLPFPFDIWQVRGQGSWAPLGDGVKRGAKAHSCHCCRVESRSGIL